MSTIPFSLPGVRGQGGDSHGRLCGNQDCRQGVGSCSSPGKVSASFYPFGREQVPDVTILTTGSRKVNHKLKKRKKKPAEGNMIILVQDFHSLFFLFLCAFGSNECLPGESRCHGFKTEKMTEGLSIEKTLHIDFIVSAHGEKVSVSWWQLLSTLVPRAMSVLCKE